MARSGVRRLGEFNIAEKSRAAGGEAMPSAMKRLAVVFLRDMLLNRFSTGI